MIRLPSIRNSTPGKSITGDSISGLSSAETPQPRRQWGDSSINTNMHFLSKQPKLSWDIAEKQMCNFLEKMTSDTPEQVAQAIDSLFKCNWKIGNSLPMHLGQGIALGLEKNVRGECFQKVQEFDRLRCIPPGSLDKLRYSIVDFRGLAEQYLKICNDLLEKEDLAPGELLHLLRDPIDAGMLPNYLELENRSFLAIGTSNQYWAPKVAWDLVETLVAIKEKVESCQENAAAGTHVKKDIPLLRQVYHAAEQMTRIVVEAMENGCCEYANAKTMLDEMKQHNLHQLVDPTLKKRIEAAYKQFEKNKRNLSL